MQVTPAPVADYPANVLAAAVAGTGLMTVYQPIVSLVDLKVVGYEALARWPRLNVTPPERVFAHAIATGELDTIDRLCAESAIRGAVRGNLPPKSVLLINSEPAATYVPDAGDATIAVGLERFQVTVELTERDLLAHPGALLRKVAAFREAGCSVALDDVGAHPDSLALLDIVRPDIVKLDMTLVQSVLQSDRVRTLAGVRAYCERTGALILAEGIETHIHHEQALAMGASLGQGFRTGRPSIVDAAPPSSATCQLPSPPRPTATPKTSVFDHISAHAPALTVDGDTARAASRDLARSAADSAYQPILLAAILSVNQYVPDLMTRYRDLARASPLVAVFGRGMPADLGGGVRGVRLSADDPLAREWLLVILDSDVATALAARPCQTDAGSCGANALYDMTITRDRAVVAEAARSILGRMP
jgi:EAL domain-containing protein (putative c-di-GMP-specific phosphodiesterase class I)